MVIDANILIRAVLGVRVRDLLIEFADRVAFLTPEVAIQEAERHIAGLAVRRGGDAAVAVALLESVAALVESVGLDFYKAHQKEAQERLAKRDPDDWPILAVALATGCPIWTEDADFFGCGVPTWTSDRIRMFLAAGD